MEGNSSRPAQGEPVAADAAAGDWRSQLHNDARQRVVNKIMGVLKRHSSASISEPEGLNKLQKIAERFEERIYTRATSQSDYLRKISLKLLSVDSNTQHTPPINRSTLYSGRPTQGQPSSAEPAAGDWQSQLQNDARERIVNKIVDTFIRHLPISVPEGLNELQKIAIRFEEKTYSEATSQSDYLRKISLKLLSMESRIQHTPPINPSMLNTTNPDLNGPGPGLANGNGV